MDLYIQKYLSFVKAVECGSFSKAAESLNYSQSGISRMIADLEKEWNVSLMERSKSGIKLTSDGLVMLPYAQNLVREFEKLQMQVDELNGLERGLIRIGAISSTARHWLPNMIAAFQRDYPNIEYEILIGDYVDIEQWVAEGRVDCGFLRLPDRSDMETILLEKDELLAIIPANHKYANEKCFPVKALCEEAFILVEKGGKAEVSELFQRHQLPLKPRYTIWDEYAVMAMVEQGLGISVMPAFALKYVPYNILTKPLDVPAYRKLGMILKDRKTASVAVKKFLEYLSLRTSEI